MYKRQTSRATLEKHCKKAAKAVGGVLRSVAVPSKKVPKQASSKKKQAGEELLQGFAFAEFGDQRTAEAAMKHLQGASLDGHKLHVEVSRTETGTSQKGATVCSDQHGAKYNPRRLHTALSVEGTERDLCACVSFCNTVGCRGERVGVSRYLLCENACSCLCWYIVFSTKEDLTLFHVCHAVLPDSVFAHLLHSLTMLDECRNGTETLLIPN